ncbi:MAG: fibronectin type III domain-containing protein [Sulfuricaulis sp.]
MDEAFHVRQQVVNFFTTVILSFVFSLILSACGGATSSDPSGAGAGVSVTNSPTAAILSWAPPTTATNVAGYRIYIGTASGVYQQPFGQGYSVGNVTNYTLMGLSSGTRYYFAVTAIDTLGNESSYSNEVYKNIP